MKILLILAFEFFKTGLFAVGGGLATLPFLYDMFERYDWLDSSIVTDMIAISESTLGPIGVNMATYLGYNAGFTIGGIGAGIISGIVSTLFLVLPSVIIIIIVAQMLDRYKNSSVIDNAFKGLRPAVCGLIASAALSVFVSACFNTELCDITGNYLSCIDIKALVLFAVLFLVNFKFKPHPIFLIVPAAVVGIMFKM